MTGALTTSSVDGAVNAASLPGDDIGAAITAQSLTMSGQGTIDIPDGTYDLSNTISISQTQFSQLTLHCHSRNGILNYTGSGDAVYITSNMNSAAQVKIQNCSIYGTGASGTANGIHLVDSQNVRLENVFVYGFPGDNFFGFGAIDTQSEGSDFSQAGHWNIHLQPDAANQFASNGNLFHGGSMQYGGSGNAWDQGTFSAYDGDANNVWDHVTSELNANVPHYIIEGTKGDAVINSYIEYIAPFTISTGDLYGVILGNYTGSGFGSSTTYPAVDFTFSGNRMLMPSAGSGHTVAALYLVNTDWLKVDQVIEDGNPTYGISFYASGTNAFDRTSGLNMGYATSLYQNAPASHNLLWWPVDAAPGLGQYTIYDDGSVHFGGIVSTTDVTATANFKNSHGTVIPSTVTGTHGTGVKIQMSDNTGVNGNYAKFGFTGELVDSGVAVGGSGGSTDFGSMTGGTNTAAVMVVGSGATLGPTGTGAITATAITGSPVVTVGGCHGCQFGITGTVTYTTNTSASTTDDGMLVKMNCASACTYTLPATQPSTTFHASIISVGAGAATVLLGGSDTFNGGTTAPVIPAVVWANTNLTTGYLGYNVGASGGGGSSTPTDLGTITYTAAGTTTFAAASAAAAAGVVTATHSTSTTFSPTGLVKWGSYTVEIKQDATGGGTTFTLGTAGTCSAWKVGGGGGGAITLSSSASAIDLLSFTYDGTNCIANFRPLFN